MKMPFRRPHWMPPWLPRVAAAVAAASVLAACSASSPASASPGAAGTTSRSAAAATNAAKVHAASDDYQLRAATAKATYYRYARSPSKATQAAATARLDNWFTGSARQAIISQVNHWDKNYSVDISVVAATQVASGHVNADGTITLHTVETWRVATEGGPVLNQDGTSTTQVTGAHRTVQLKHFRFGWAATSIT